MGLGKSLEVENHGFLGTRLREDRLVGLFAPFRGPGRVLDDSPLWRVGATQK